MLNKYFAFSLFLPILFSYSSSIPIYPYQSHSFNDLDYIIQQLKRGVDDLKIDISMADYTSCSGYSTWKTTDNPCEAIGFDTEICCLGFRGDCSSAPLFRDYFNTTIDLIKLLNSTTLDYIWNKNKRLPEYNRTIQISFDIQQIAASDIFTYWIYNMMTIIQKRNLDIIPIMDGVGSTYIQYCQENTCNYQEQYIANYPWKYSCGEGSGDCFNFNIPVSELSSDCEIGFPPWSLNSPLTFYEFAQQAPLYEAVETFLSPSCKKNPGQETLASVRLTSNMDLEMLQTYLPQPSYISFRNTSHHFLEEFINNTTLLTFYDYNTSSSHIQVRSLNQQNFFSLIYDFAFPEAGMILNLTYKQSQLLIQNETGGFLFNTNFTNNILTLTPIYSINILNPIGIDLTFSPNGNSFIATIQKPASTCSGMLLSIFDVKANEQTSKCITNPGAFSVQNINSGDIAIASLSSNPNIITGLCFISANQPYLNVIKPIIYGFTFNYSISTGQIIYNSPKSYLDFGSNPFLKLYNNNGTLFVLEAHSFSSAPCGTLIDNGNTYKCGLPNTNDPHKALLQSIPYVLNYNWGTLTSIQDRILTGKFLGPCDKQIIHAKYANGDYPNGIVYKNQTTGHLQAILINQHVPFLDLPTYTKLLAGAKMPSAGEGESLDVNIFDVVDYNLFKNF